MVTAENLGSLKVLRVHHGIVNAPEPEVLRALAGELRALGQVRGLLLTGTDRIFSAGADLRRLLESDSDYTRAFLGEPDALVQTIFQLPIAVVSALTGHATAGGCLIAAACDYRVMGQRRIGVTGPTAGLVLTGRTREVPETLDLGLINEIAEPGSVLARAMEVASQVASSPARTSALRKSMLRADARRRMREVVAEHGADVVATSLEGCLLESFSTSFSVDWVVHTTAPGTRDSAPVRYPCTDPGRSLQDIEV